MPYQFVGFLVRSWTGVALYPGTQYALGTFYKALPDVMRDGWLLSHCLYAVITEWGWSFVGSRRSRVRVSIFSCIQNPCYLAWTSMVGLSCKRYSESNSGTKTARPVCNDDAISAGCGVLQHKLIESQSHMDTCSTPQVLATSARTVTSVMEEIAWLHGAKHMHNTHQS